MMYVHEVIPRALKEFGVDTLFGVIGDANLFLADHFVRSCGGRYISAANEAGAGLMGLGYASTSMNIGVVTVTHGPGLTNLVTPLIEGVRNRSRLLVVAGDTDPSVVGHLQDVDQARIVDGTGAGFVQVQSSETVVSDLRFAMEQVFREHRPVVFNIPANLAWQEVSQEIHFDLIQRSVPLSVDVESDAMDAAVGIIATAKRPVVLAGRGVVESGARADVLALARRIGAAVATTVRAKDLFRGVDADMGILGTVMQEDSYELVQKADCIVAFGASLNPMTTADGSVLEGKRLVQCDIDPARMEAFTPVDAAVVGDAGLVAKAFITCLDDIGVPTTGFNSSSFVSKSSRGPAIRPSSPPPSSIDIRTILDDLDLALPDRRTLVMDGGRFMYETWRRVRTDDPRWFVHTSSFGSIGLGVAEGIGASFGGRDRPVVVMAGDGGFMLGGLAEFNTAVRHDIDMIVVVLNDGAYGAEHIQFLRRDMDPSLSTFDWPDIAAVARGLGGEGVTVKSMSESAKMGKAIARRKAPLVIDIRLDPFTIPDG